MSNDKRCAGVPPQPRRGTTPIPVGRADHLPDLRPAAGHYLLAGVETVLSQVASSCTASPNWLADQLLGALARTAACGDTCRVRGAADAVRVAARLLLSGSLTEAQLVLAAVRANLTGPSGQGQRRPPPYALATHETDGRDHHKWDSADHHQSVKALDDINRHRTHGQHHQSDH